MGYNVSVRYVGKTFKYMFGAMGVLSLICLPAAIVLGIFTKPMASLTYLVAYSGTDVRGFTDVLWLVFNRYATVYVYPLVLIFVTLVFCSSLALSVIEKHFRVGKLMLRTPLRQVNNYFLPVLITFAILAGLTALYGIVQTGVISLLQVIIGGWGVPGVLNVILAAVLSIALFALCVYVFCSLTYWVPMMVIYGFSFRDAAASSLRLLDGKSLEVFGGVILPFFIVAVVETLVEFVGNIYVTVCVAIVLYLFLIIYLLSFVMVSMFELNNMERRDKYGKSGGYASGV